MLAALLGISIQIAALMRLSIRNQGNVNLGTEAKIWVGIQHIEPINKTEQTLLKALLLVGIKGLI